MNLMLPSTGVHALLVFYMKEWADTRFSFPGRKMLTQVFEMKDVTKWLFHGPDNAREEEC